MLTDKEVQLINAQGDCIRDEAIGLAAQHAVREYGTDADLVEPAVHRVLRELRAMARE